MQKQDIVESTFRMIYEWIRIIQRFNIQMATAQIRKSLAERNHVLREDYIRLKSLKAEITDHLATLLRRAKQMETLKTTLRQDLVKAEEDARVHKNKRIAYIGFLTEDIKKLEDEYSVESIKLKNLEAEYQACLEDYDEILRKVTAEIETAKLLESEIMREKQVNANMKAMIFDYERLKRVLEEEKKYFKELSNSEEKSHEERVRELRKIRNKLLEEEKDTEGNYKLSRFRFAFLRVNALFSKKIRQYAQVFLRQEIVIGCKAKLGIKIFKNCLQLGNLKHKLSTRKLFYKWHHNVFPKSTLSGIVEEATRIDVETQRKIRILNRMHEVVNEKNLELFHQYEKGKYVSVLANKVGRKDLHYGFNRWRENYQHQTQVYNKLGKMFYKVIPSYEKRQAFGKWRQNSNFETRLIIANQLLEDYMTTKELARLFRRWRFQLPNDDLRAVNKYIDKVKTRNKIQSRINYEKRKTKVLMSLAFKMGKIKLRNYFHKYWANVKGQRIDELRDEVEEKKSTFSALRKEDKATDTKIKGKNKDFSVRTFRAFMLNLKLRPVMRKWRNTALVLKRRSQVISHLAMRKENKNKICVMNNFRMCVQYYEKKEMHQVLTDLNNKMEAINEKSTMFRNKLQKCIEELGIMASKKIDYIFSYSVFCQQRVYFNQDLRLKVKTLYREYLLQRFGHIFANVKMKNGFDEVLLFSKKMKKQTTIKKNCENYHKQKNKKILQKGFYGWRGIIKSYKGFFRKMTQPENINMFYRMASAFSAVQRKCFAEKVKATNKKIDSSNTLLESKLENFNNFESNKAKIEESLKKVFCNFIQFEDRNMKMKQTEITKALTKRYFLKYRENVQAQIYGEKILNHFAGFINQKNNFIFWKGMKSTMYENIIALVKEQLGKLNKKKKAFEEKSSKGRVDYEKRLNDATEQHEVNLKYYSYYLKKFEDTLNYFVSRNSSNEKKYYTQQIFKAWKRQYQGSKRMALGANRVLQRNLVHPACLEIIKIMKKIKGIEKSRYMCADIMLKKGKNCMKDCLILWRTNMRKLKCEKMQSQAEYMIENREDIVDECKVKSGLISTEKLREKRKRLLITCFMAMKTDWTEAVSLKRYKLDKMDKKINDRIIKTAMKGLKWLMFYKKTKRAYLKYTKQKFERELKSDVFLSLKIYRQEHYDLVSKAQGVYDNIHHQYLRFSLDKIINVGAYERDELNYERRRALRCLVMNKVSRVQIIKMKIMAKWKAWLIPRFHYLPTVMKSCELGVLKRSFANIREHAYWHPIYIKATADKITSEGYNEVTTNTNNLVKEGYDPDDIKDFLAERNEKDNKIIKSVVNRTKVWGDRQDLVRAWNSWVQYLELKKKIKKSLAKVFNISQGIGRYWNRWKSKDPEFNAILQKESRGNMLERYRDLGRLLKEYKRDVKDSRIYVAELKEINDEYAEKNDEGVRMALSTLSNNLKVGMKQGLQIWRGRVKTHQRAQFDYRYEQLSNGISMLVEQRNKKRYKLAALKEENTQMKEKCNLGAECGLILEKLLKERDNLSIDLADKEHNLKLLLEDNLRLKQKIRAARQNAEKLIHNVQAIEPTS